MCTCVCVNVQAHECVRVCVCGHVRTRARVGVCSMCAITMPYNKHSILRSITVDLDNTITHNNTCDSVLYFQQARTHQT